MPRSITCHTRTSDFRTIDIAWLQRQGARAVGYSGRIRWLRRGEEKASIGYVVVRNGLRLRYQHTRYGGDPQDVDEVIGIVTTPMHLGGVRHWFSCPSCRRRCRILYGGSHYRCRQCRGALYESQYQHAALTVCDRRWGIRKHLEERGGELTEVLGLDDGFPPKPKGMHWRTYRRLEALDKQLERRWCIGMSGFLERLDRRTYNGKASPLRR